MAELKRLSKSLTTTPDGFTLHPRVRRSSTTARRWAKASPLDWGMGENLAYASLVVQGFGVRLSGEDVGRGTFFHRHAALHDQNRDQWDDGTYYPLQNIRDGQAPFYCYDSVLSEEAVLAFEYGYATAEPNQLVIWEAQFGDFANGAQVVMDQFIAPAKPSGAVSAAS
jgi:2-oxoglutarate dehydrogenase E1 component